MTERRQFVGHSSTAEAAQFTGRSREITVDMQAETLRVHDGITPGGYPLMRADMANLDPAVLNGKLSVFERLANKVTTITQFVTNTAYPTALAVWKLCLTKLNLNLDNLNDDGKAVINSLASEVAKSLGFAETITSGNNFAFKLGNGYVIQGGYINDNSNDSTVFLPVEMASKNYTAIATAMDVGGGSGGGGKYFAGVIVSHETNRIVVSRGLYENSHYWHATNPMGWLVIGKYKEVS